MTHQHRPTPRIDRLRRLLAGAGRVAVAAVMAAAAGCSSDQPTVASSSPAESASSPAVTTPSPAVSTPSPSVTAYTVMPSAAKQHNGKGAEAFIRFYIALVNEGAKRPVAGILAPYSDKGCKSCKSFNEGMQEYVTKKYRARGDVLTVSETHFAGTTPDDISRVRFEMIQNKVDIVDQTGATVETEPRLTNWHTVALKWRNNQWIVWGIA